MCSGEGEIGPGYVNNWVGRTHILWAQYSIHAGFQFALTLLKATPLKKMHCGREMSEMVVIYWIWDFNIHNYDLVTRK